MAPERIEDFLEAYRNAFEAFDASAVADLFVYPAQITSDAGEKPVTTVTNETARLRAALVGHAQRRGE